MSGAIEIKIPGYRIEQTLGKGGMATVYLGTQMSLGRAVALKVLDDPETPQFFERFFNEGRCVARLNHSSLINIYDIGQVDGFYYIAMEYLPGGDLKSRIVQGIKPSLALKILSRLTSCLSYVHNEGVIHRDIKPSNILFRSDGTPVLSDFGIAKLIQSDNDLTVTGTVMGSPHYLSPEQAHGERRLDGRSDLYSLGIIFFEMLTGRKPITAESFAATLMAHINGPLPKLPDQFTRFQPLLNRMLAKKPEKRFQSGAELQKEIQLLRSQERLIKSRENTGSIPVAGEPPVKKVARPGFLLRFALASVVLLALTWLVMEQISPPPNVTAVAEEKSPYPQQASDTGQPGQEPATGAKPPAEVAAVEAEPPAPVKSRKPAKPKPSQAQLRAKKIDRLLQQGDARLAVNKLTRPEGDSAYDYYRAALKRDPGNSRAQLGIEQIADRYAELASNHLKLGKTVRARRQINKGLEIQPDHQTLQSMLADLDTVSHPQVVPNWEQALNPEFGN